MIARQREVDAVKLRLEGKSFEEIAEALGIVKASAYRAVVRVLKRHLATSAEDVTELRQLELERCDALQAAVWPMAIGQGLDGVDLDAVEVVLKIMARRAKYMGLDAPTELQHSGTMHVKVSADDLTDDELAAIAARGGAGVAAQAASAAESA